jgi:hypothetical protein
MFKSKITQFHPDSKNSLQPDQLICFFSHSNNSDTPNGKLILFSNDLSNEKID